MAKTAVPQSNPGSSVNKKLLLGGAAILVVLAAVIVAARPGPAQKAPARVEAPASRTLVAKHASFDFGSLSMASGKVAHRYWIRNTGVEPIVLRRMYTSCMCTTAALVKGGRKFNSYGMPGHGFMPDLNEAVAPNEEAMVEAVFDPAAHGPAGVGRIERYVIIQTDREKPLELAFVANVTP